MSESTFKPGDSVRLRYAGPGMHVIDIGTYTGLVLCRWIGDDGRLNEGTFRADVLRIDRGSGIQALQPLSRQQTDGDAK